MAFRGHSFSFRAFFRPMAHWRLLFLGILGAILAIASADWAVSTVRLTDVVIESHLDPPEVLADGRSSTTITLHITDKGRPRAGDLVQLWIDSGSGLVIPDWVITDEHGIARTQFSPNAASIYDPHDEARIYAMDIDIGRVIEVGKRHLVVVPLIAPKD